MSGGQRSQTSEAIILCGGRGTRLQSVVSDRPKPMAPIGEQSFLDFLIGRLVEQGITHIVLAAGYMADVIAHRLPVWRQLVDIELSVEDEPLGTGGAAKQALSYLHGERAFVLNGDSFCAMDLAALDSKHRESAAAVTMQLAQVDSSDSFGAVEFNEDGCITAFTEKDHSARSPWVNAGVYLLESSVLDDIHSGKAFSLEYELFPKLVGKGLYAYPSQEPLYDIGTPERYRRAVEALGQG